MDKMCIKNILTSVSPLLVTSEARPSLSDFIFIPAMSYMWRVKTYPSFDAEAILQYPASRTGAVHLKMAESEFVLFGSSNGTIVACAVNKLNGNSSEVCFKQ